MIQLFKGKKLARVLILFIIFYLIIPGGSILCLPVNGQVNIEFSRNHDFQHQNILDIIAESNIQNKFIKNTVKCNYCIDIEIKKNDNQSLISSNSNLLQDLLEKILINDYINQEIKVVNFNQINNKIQTNLLKRNLDLSFLNTVILII